MVQTGVNLWNLSEEFEMCIEGAAKHWNSALEK